MQKFAGPCSRLCKATLVCQATISLTGAGMSRGNKGGSSNSGGRRTAQDFIDDMKRLDGDKQYGSSKSEGHSGMASLIF